MPAALPKLAVITGKEIRWIIPEIPVPTFEEYSPQIAFFSASLILCKITCLAVWAAIQPNPGGVTFFLPLASFTSPELASRSTTMPSGSPKSLR